jgi:hypothetical protein
MVPKKEEKKSGGDELLPNTVVSSPPWNWSLHYCAAVSIHTGLLSYRITH